MIAVIKSEITACTCDCRRMDEVELLERNLQHINEVSKGFEFFIDRLEKKKERHDWDKIEHDEWFHRNFVTGFEQRDWLDNHYKVSRHHLETPEGIPANVNLLDVLEHIIDSIMGGLARGDDVSQSNMTPELLKDAYDNTVKLLSKKVKVVNNVREADELENGHE